MIAGRRIRGRSAGGSEDGPEAVAPCDAARRSVQFVRVAEYLWRWCKRRSTGSALTPAWWPQSTRCGREHLQRSLRSDREFVGAIVENGAGEYWTSVGSGCSGQDTVTFAVQIPTAARLAAFWHTHGAAAASRDLFSPDDVDLVRNTGREFYLITPRGEISVLRADDVAGVGATGAGRMRASRSDDRPRRELECGRRSTHGKRRPSCCRASARGRRADQMVGHPAACRLQSRDVAVAASKMRIDTAPCLGDQAHPHCTETPGTRH